MAKRKRPPILVWRWEDAPQKYRKLSDHGGNEDWLAYVPDVYVKDWIGWIEGVGFGCCDVSAHTAPGGIVRIGAHA